MGTFSSFIAWTACYNCDWKSTKQEVSGDDRKAIKMAKERS